MSAAAAAMTSVAGRLGACALVVFGVVACDDSGDDDAEDGSTDPPPASAVDVAVSVEIEPEAVNAAAEAGVDLDALVDETVEAVANVFPDIEATVRVQDDPAMVIPEIGVGGGTNPATREVTIPVDTSRLDADTVNTWVPCLLAHELYHAEAVRRIPRTGMDRALADLLVAEGLGTAFCEEMFPATPDQPWAIALDEEEQRQWWATAQAQLDRRGGFELLTEWFFGSGPVPRWAGYSLGVGIVESYLDAHPGETVADLIDVPATTIIAGSGYDP